MVLTDQVSLLAYVWVDAINKMEEHKLKPFKLRRPVLVGERPTGIIIAWKVWIVVCAIVIVLAGVVGWVDPWFRPLEAYIITTILIIACLFRYQSHQK
jgi:hypothetical protein